MIDNLKKIPSSIITCFFEMCLKKYEIINSWDGIIATAVQQSCNVGAVLQKVFNQPQLVEKDQV